MTKARDIADFKFEDIVDTGTEGTKVASGTTAQRGSTTGQWRFNTTTGFFEGKGATDFLTLEPTPTITSVDVAEVDSQAGGNQTIVVSGTNFTSGGTIAFVGSSAEFNATTTTFNNATQVTAVAPKASFLNAQEPYKVKFTSTSGVSGSSATGLINVDTNPSWSTASGTLATINDNATGTHATVSATDADNDTIAYSVQSGSIPAGTSLNSSTGAISGDPTDVSSATTSNFTLRATANTKTVDRAFSIIVNPFLDGSTSAKANTSAKGIRDLGITTDGVYYLKNANGDTYQAYCEMGVQGGGWELIWNTAGSGTYNSDPRSDFAGYNNKNFWTNQSYTVGTHATPFNSVMYKSSGFQYRNDFTKIMIVAHNAGSACTDDFDGSTSTNFGDIGGIWTLNNTYANKSWYQLMNDYANATTIATFTTQMGALTNSNQTSGIIANTTRNGVKNSSDGSGDDRCIGLPLFDNQLDLVTNLYLKGSNQSGSSANFDSNGGLYDLNERTPTTYSGSNSAGNSSNRSPDFVMEYSTNINMARLTGKYSQRNLDVRNLSNSGAHNGHQTQGGLGIHHRRSDHLIHSHAHFSLGYHQGELSMGTSENQNFDGGNGAFYEGGSTSSPSTPIIGRSRVDFAIFVKKD